MSEEMEQTSGYALDRTSLSILGFTGTRPASRTPDERKAGRREGKKQLQGHLSPTIIDILDHLASKLEVTKQDIVALVMNTVFERLDARVSPLIDEQEKAAALAAELDLLAVNPDASRDEIERVRETRIEDLRSTHREGEPFRLKLEKEIRDVVSSRSKKKVPSFSTARRYGPIRFDRAKQNAECRLEAFQLYKERGLADMSKSERLEALQAIRVERSDLASALDRWIENEKRGAQATTPKAKSREGKRPLSGWFDVLDTFEVKKLVAGGLGGAPTSTQKVIEAGARLLILDNLDLLDPDELTDEQREAIDILHDATPEEVYKMIDAPPNEREERPGNPEAQQKPPKAKPAKAASKPRAKAKA